MSTAKRVSFNALLLLLGSVATQVLNLVYVSILARYVGVTGIGKISTGQALIGSAFILVNFGFNVSLVREVAADLSRARTYVPNVIYLRLLFTFVVLTVMAAVVPFSPYSADTKIIIGLYGLVSFFDALSDTLRCVFNAHQRMGFRAGIEFGRQVVNVAVSLIGIQLGWTLIQLVAVSVGASLVRMLVTSWVVRTRFVRLQWGLDLGLARHLVTISVPYFLGYLVSVISQQFGVVLLSWLSTEEAVGLYSAALLPIVTILFVPDMIMDSVFPVMAHAFATSHEKLVRTYEVGYRVMLMIGFPMGAGSMLVAPEVMALVLGEEFVVAAPLMVFFSIHLFTIPGYVSGYFLGATARQGLFTAIRSVLAVLGLVLYLLLIPRYGFWGAASSYLAVSLLDFTIFTVLCLRITGTSFPWLVTLKLGAATAAMYGFGYLLKATLQPHLLVLILASAVVYALGVVVLRAVGPDELNVLRETRPGKALDKWLARIIRKEQDE